MQKTNLYEGLVLESRHHHACHAPILVARRGAKARLATRKAQPVRWNCSEEQNADMWSRAHQPLTLSRLEPISVKTKKRSHGYLTGSMQHRDAQPRSAVSAIQFEPWRRAASYVLWQSRAVSRLDLVTVLAYLPSSRPAHVKSVCMAQLDQCSRGQTTK
jgi:hypothetical protein